MNKTILRIMGFLACFILLFSYVEAQSEDSCYAKAPAEVAVGQPFKYTVTTHTQGDVISTDFGKFELVSGPSVGTSTSITMINGQVEQNTTYTYTYYLSSDKEGSFSIPGVTISVDGRLIKSNLILVKVVKAPKNLQAEEPFSKPQQMDSWFNFSWPDDMSMNPFRSQQPNNNSKVEIDDKVGKDDMFIKATTSKMEAYQGESIVVTHKLYIKDNIRGYHIERANFAQTDALWMDALTISRDEQTTETINGKQYTVFTIKQTAVYPCKTGKITIPKLNVSLLIAVPATVKDPFWGTISTSRNKEVHLTSNELTVKVKALPGSRSTEVTDVVGNFTVSSSLSSTETYANEPVTLTITVTGSGNLHHVSADDFGIEFPVDCDVTYPRVSTHVSAKGDIITGSKTFKYTIIPRSEGTFFIPGMTYSYYNYEMGTYRTISSQDYQLEVKPARKSTHPSLTEPTEEKKTSTKGKTYKI